MLFLTLPCLVAMWWRCQSAPYWAPSLMYFSWRHCDWLLTSMRLAHAIMKLVALGVGSHRRWQCRRACQRVVGSVMTCAIAYNDMLLEISSTNIIELRFSVHDASTRRIISPMWNKAASLNRVVAAWGSKAKVLYSRREDCLLSDSNWFGVIIHKSSAF